MAVRLHAAGREQAALRIESLNALRRVDRLADGGDFPVFEEQAAVFRSGPAMVLIFALRISSIVVLLSCAVRTWFLFPV